MNFINYLELLIMVFDIFGGFYSIIIREIELSEEPNFGRASGR